MIEFRNLVIGHNIEYAVQVNFESLTSGLYFLIGANGSGKSTFIKTLFGEVPPLSGEVVFRQKEGNQNSSMLKKAQQISFLSTGIPIIDYLTVRDFIALGETPFMNRFGKIEGEHANSSAFFMEHFGLQKHLESHLNQLSDGEKQLIGIAKSIQQNTSILLMDEPTSFLDPKNKRLLFDFLKKFSEQESKTIIISTHDIEVALPYAKSLLLIEKKSMSLKSNMDLNTILTIY